MAKKAAIITIVVVVIIIIAIIVGVILYKRKDYFRFDNSDYQYANANVSRQYNYYECVDKLCNGDTDNYQCLDACRLKTYRYDMKSPDIKDLVCEQYATPDTPNYYRCLDDVYADYKYP